MKRERRQEIVNRTLVYIANAVRDLPDVDGGLYDGLAEYGTPEYKEETDLAVATCIRVAEQLRRRGGRDG